MTAFVSVSQILFRSYWRRAWIRQEIAVSPAHPIILCDSRKIVWNTFAWVFDTFKLTDKGLTSQEYHHPTSLLRFGLRQDVYQGRATEAYAESMIGEPKTNLCNIFDMFEYGLATNPRDHVYSLVGLVKSTSGSPVPDSRS